MKFLSNLNPTTFVIKIILFVGVFFLLRYAVIRTYDNISFNNPRVASKIVVLSDSLSLSKSSLTEALNKVKQGREDSVNFVSQRAEFQILIQGLNKENKGLKTTVETYRKNNKVCYIFVNPFFGKSYYKEVNCESVQPIVERY